MGFNNFNLPLDGLRGNGRMKAISFIIAITAPIAAIYHIQAGNSDTGILLLILSVLWVICGWLQVISERLKK